VYEITPLILYWGMLKLLLSIDFFIVLLPLSTSLLLSIDFFITQMPSFALSLIYN
jgi:hypothetical protein